MKEANLNSSPHEPGTTLLSAAHVEAKAGRWSLWETTNAANKEDTVNVPPCNVYQSPNAWQTILANCQNSFSNSITIFIYV